MSRIIGIFALIFLGMLVIGHIVELPAWLWVAVLVIGLALIVIDKATTKRNTLH